MADNAWPTPSHVLAARAVEDPNGLGFVFLRGGELSESARIEMTFGELDRRARTLARDLVQTVGVGERAVLLYPPGLDFILALYACFYAGVIAVPAYPPDPSRLARTLPRLEAIIGNAEARSVLTTTPIEMIAEGIFDLAPGLRDLRWISTDVDVGGDAPGDLPLPAESQVAFLQYTSGSTGAPKGVMVTHGNLAANVRSIVAHHQLGPKSCVVSWLPQYHDMGLIGGIMTLMRAGGYSVLMSPMDFLQQPLRWLRAISAFRADIVTAPNFAYDLCVRKTDPAQRREVDLSSVRHALNGAEPVRHATLQRFAAAFAACGFRPHAFRPTYGLAEATLMVTNSAADTLATTVFATPESVAAGTIKQVPESPKTLAFVSCGSAVDQEILVVDPETARPCEPFQIGEVWVRGANVAKGYWGLADETKQTFEASTVSGERPYLRTGDLGFLVRGELFIAGRLKDLLIVRGRNYYPTDLEKSAEECHPALRPGCGAAFSIDGGEDGEEHAALVYEMDDRAGASPDAIAALIYQSVLLTHDLPLDQIVLIESRTLPKTSSGKVMRSATRDALLAGRLAALTTWRRPTEADVQKQASSADSLQGWMVAWCAESLRIPASAIDPSTSLAAYGLNSLAAVDFAAALSAKVGYAVEATLLFDFSTIDALCAHLAAIERAGGGGNGDEGPR